jgi:hypothetical protein
MGIIIRGLGFTGLPITKGRITEKYLFFSAWKETVN